MLVDTRFIAFGLEGVATPVRVVLVTLGTGLGVKAGALALWRNTDALFSPLTYFKGGFLLLLASIAVLLSVRRGLASGSTGTQVVYALLLANSSISR